MTPMEQVPGVVAAVRSALHDPRARSFLVVQRLVGVLVLASVALAFVDLGLARRAFPLDHPAVAALATADRVLLLVFAGELALRVLTFRPPELEFFALGRAERLRTALLGRARFLLEPLNLVDLVTVLAVVPALRGLRLLRLLRLLRGGSLFRYHNPLAGTLRAFAENRLLYAGALTLLGLTVALGGATLYLIESPVNDAIGSLGDGVWWAIVTVTTVGYGDIAPITDLGRLLGGVLMVIGMLLLALFAGIVGSTLLQAVLGIREEQYRMASPLNHIVVCGYEPGTRLALDTIDAELDLLRCAVYLFAPGERPADVPPDFHWVSGDPTKERELDKVHLHRASAAILLGPRSVSPQQADATTVLTAFTIRSWMRKHPQAGRRALPLHVVAEILDHENQEHARAAGADEVIETSYVGFSMLAHAVVQKGTADLLSRVASAGAESVYVGRLPADIEGDRPFDDVARDLRRSHGLLLLGVRGADGEDVLNPPLDQRVEPGATLVYLARKAVLPLP